MWVARPPLRSCLSVQHLKTKQFVGFSRNLASALQKFSTGVCFSDSRSYKRRKYFYQSFSDLVKDLGEIQHKLSAQYAVERLRGS